MLTIDTSSDVVREMAKGLMGPKQIECNGCKKFVANLISNNEENNFIYGVIVNHARIICGIHEGFAYETVEKIICFCESCQGGILEKIPEVKGADDSPKPIAEKGHFITVSFMDKKGTTLSRWLFQCKAKTFIKIMKVLED